MSAPKCSVHGHIRPGMALLDPSSLLLILASPRPESMPELKPFLEFYIIELLEKSDIIEIQLYPRVRGLPSSGRLYGVL
jgi:hypothetical protein